MGLKKRDPSSSNGPGTPAAACTSSSDLAMFPTLIEFLFSTRWEDGTSRLPGTLLIFMDGGRLKACLSDRDQGLVAFVTGGSTSELLSASERLLDDEGADWRPQRKPHTRGAERK